MNELVTSNGELVKEFRVVKTIEQALKLPTPIGSIVLLEKYPVCSKQGNWKLTSCTKISRYVSHLCNNQGIILLVSEHKITAYAKFNEQIHSLSEKLPWTTFLNNNIRF